MWKYYALLAALFAALRAIFSKLGVKDINSDLALAIRISFILLLVWGIVFYTDAAREIKTLGWNAWIFLFASAIATGLSWLFYFKALACGDVSRVAPLDKLSVPISILLAFLLLGRIFHGCLRPGIAERSRIAAGASRLWRFNDGKTNGNLQARARPSGNSC